MRYWCLSMRMITYAGLLSFASFACARRTCSRSYACSTVPRPPSSNSLEAFPDDISTSSGPGTGRAKANTWASTPGSAIAVSPPTQARRRSTAARRAPPSPGIAALGPKFGMATSPWPSPQSAEGWRGCPERQDIRLGRRGTWLAVTCSLFPRARGGQAKRLRHPPPPAAPQVGLLGVRRASRCVRQSCAGLLSDRLVGPKSASGRGCGWLARPSARKGTAPRINPTDRHRLDLVIYGATRRKHVTYRTRSSNVVCRVF